MRGLRAKRLRPVKEGTLIAAVDIGVANDTGYCTTLDGRSTKSFRFDNTKEGFERFWCMIVASKNRFGCDEVLVGYESNGPYPEPLVHYLANRQAKIAQVNPMHTKKMKEVNALVCFVLGMNTRKVSAAYLYIIRGEGICHGDK